MRSWVCFATSGGVFWRRSRANFLLQRFKRVTMALSGPSASPPMASSTGLVARTVLSSCGKHAANPTGCGDELDTFIIVTVYRRNHGRMTSSSTFICDPCSIYNWRLPLGLCSIDLYLAVIHWLQATSRSLYAGFMACVHLF